MNIVGIDLGGTWIRGALFSYISGEKNIYRVTDMYRLETQRFREASEIVTDIIDIITQCSYHSDQSLDYIGISIPTTSRKYGRLDQCRNLPTMDDFPLVSALAEKVSTSIYLENDVNCMALGEYISLEQPVQSLVYISLGTSIGMGLVENYSILKGAHNQAGEIWRIPVECIHKKISKQGILHDFVSGEGIENAYKNVTGISLSAERIGELARTGDTLALMLYQTLGEILGKALVWIGNIIDPEILVLGGSVVKSNDLFIQNITNNFHENNITLHISSKGDDAALRGAAYASIQQHEQINE